LRIAPVILRLSRARDERGDDCGGCEYQEAPYRCAQHESGAALGQTESTEASSRFGRIRTSNVFDWLDGDDLDRLMKAFQLDLPGGITPNAIHVTRQVHDFHGCQDITCCCTAAQAGSTVQRRATKTAVDGDRFTSVKSDADRQRLMRLGGCCRIAVRLLQGDGCPQGLA